jgi:serine/threonine-protein kinase
VASAKQLLPELGDVIADKYQIESLLGRGGMGAVFKVSHKVTGKCFAIKWMLPRVDPESDAVDRFIREAKVAGRVDHPNVVEVYDVAQQDDSFFMVMELLEGEPLGYRIASRGQQSPLEACRILLRVARGVSAAHDAGVIHRDLKPDNIFLCLGEGGDEIPKVLDFGISKMSSKAGEVSATITREGTVIGTPHYMAPEQLQAQGTDARTDVYALGVILYEMLSGELPFPGESYGELVMKIMASSPKPLAALAPRTPRALINIVAKAMSLSPAKRHASVAEFGRALEPFTDGLRFDIRYVRTQPGVPLNPSVRAPRTTPLSTESKQLASGTRSIRLRAPLLWTATLLGIGALSVFIAWHTFRTGDRTAPSVRAAAAVTKPSVVETRPLASPTPSSAAALGSAAQQLRANPDVAPVQPVAPEVIADDKLHRATLAALKPERSAAHAPRNNPHAPTRTDLLPRSAASSDTPAPRPVTGVTHRSSSLSEKDF